MIRAFLLALPAPPSLPRYRCSAVSTSLGRAELTRRLPRTADDYWTDSDSAGEQDAGPNSPQGSRGPLQPGQGLQGRKLQLGYGGGVQGAGASFRTPEQEAAEDARRMRLFRGMQATVVLAVLSAAVMITLAVIEENAAVSCSVGGAATRTEEITLTVDTTLGLQTLTVRSHSRGRSCDMVYAPCQLLCRRCAYGAPCSAAPSCRFSGIHIRGRHQSAAEYGDAGPSYRDSVCRAVRTGRHCA